MKNLKAVITADIVNSSLLTKDEFNSLLKSTAYIFRKAGFKFGFYRGDSFHALCEPEDAFRICCLIRTLAIKFSNKEEKKEIDIRMSIGIGTVDHPVRNLGTAKGEAFVLSGREMENLERSDVRLAIRCTDEIAETGFSALALFSDYILKKMTARQAGVIHELLKGAIQVKVAKKLHKAQSTVNKHAASGNWKELETLLGIYNRMVQVVG